MKVPRAATTAPSRWTKRSRSPSRCSRQSSGRPPRTFTARVLEAAPDHADALHFSGVLAHQRGRSDDAIALIERSLELEPERADWYSNLGIVLQHRLRLDDAITAYRRAIALDPAHANAHSNLGVVFRAKGELAEAEAAYRAAIRARSRPLDAYHNLGVLLNAQKRPREAALCFSKVITLRPKDPEAAGCWRSRTARSARSRGSARSSRNGSMTSRTIPIARHMLAACSGRDVPARASDAFVERTFDSFAASFDSKLAKLSYRAPRLCGDAGAIGRRPSKSLDVLDAGCGTGLCGPLARAVRAPAGRGRSLATDARPGARKECLRRARQGRADRATWPAARETFDVIVSADTLVYFGPLDDVSRLRRTRSARAATDLHRRGVQVTEQTPVRAIRSEPGSGYRRAHDYVQPSWTRRSLHRGRSSVELGSRLSQSRFGAFGGDCLELTGRTSVVGRVA